MTAAGIVALIEATPRRPADGTPVTVRLCWNAVTRADFFDVQWYPGILTMPSFESNLAFDGTKFGQGARPTVGQLVIGIDPVTAPLASLVWKNAPIVLRVAARPAAGDPADADFAVVWSGRTDTLAEKEGELTIVALDAGLPLDLPLQPVLFGTSGSALLDGTDAVDKAGQPVPMGWGSLSAAPGMLVDKSYNIWIVIGRPATAITAIEDGGAPFILGVSQPDLATLRAESPAEGAADYCLDADGLVLVRPWTAPTYPLIVDLTTAETTPAQIAAAIVAARSGLTFTAGAVAAFDALVPAAAQLYTADGKTIANALDLIFPPLGAYWKINSLGTIDLGRLQRSAVATRDAGTIMGPVTRLATVMPTGRRTLGYATNNRVLGTNEIAQVLTADNAEAIGGVPAATLLGEVSAAAAAATAATAELAAISSDDILTPGEKATAIRDADVVAAEQAGFDAQADAFAVVDAKATYDSAVGGLATYLGTLVVPVAWNDLTGNTAIDGPTFRARFAAAFEARSALLTAIAAAAAVWNNQSGPGLPAANATVNDDGANMIASPSLLADLTTSDPTRISALTMPAGDASGAARAVNFAPGANGDALFGSGAPCRPGETLYASIRLFSDHVVTTPVAATAQLRVEWQDATGAHQSYSAVPGTQCTAGTATMPDAIWFGVAGSVVVPPNAALALLHASADVPGSAATEGILAALPLLDRSQAGADVTALNTPSLAVPTGVTVNADYTGAVIAGQLPATLQGVRQRGNADVSSAATWTVAGSNCTVSVDATGLATLTGVASNGFIAWTSTIDGVTLTGQTVVAKNNAPPPAAGAAGSTGGTSDYSSSIGGCSSTSYGSAATRVLSLTAGSAGRIDFSAPLTFTGSGYAVGKWQLRAAGGTFADVPGGETVADDPATANRPGEPGDTGDIAVSQSKTGLTSGAAYEAQLLLRRSAGSGVFNFFGTATAVGS